MPIGTEAESVSSATPSTVQEEALIVHSVGPYRLTSWQEGSARKQRRARLFDSASPPLKIWVNVLACADSPLSRSACSSVGTHCSAVTRCSAIICSICSGSRCTPGLPTTTRAPQLLARISHCAASKLIGVFCKTTVDGPRSQAASSHLIWLTMLRCSIITPLGPPVLPEV